MSRINSLLTLIITVLIVLPSFAQEDDPKNVQPITEQHKIEMAIKNYKKALESDNSGMIESAIINVMKLKYNYPDYDYSSLVQPLASLESTDMSKPIRFMAYIVKNYLEYPDRYAWMKDVQIKSDIDLYAAFAQKISEQVEE
jgi:hypothetical protein